MREEPALVGRRVGPTNPFIEFRKEEIEQAIQQRFEEQVRRYPDRLAVKTRACELTYAELNAAANRVAHAILAAGGESGAPVALLCDRGAPLITALLGALKAGRIFVTLDRGHPPARLADILEDARAELIVASDANVALATGLAQGRLPVLNIDALDAGLSCENPGLPVPPDAVAYLFYTSGSTGKPKGVVQNHRNFLHLIRGQGNARHVVKEDRMFMPTLASRNIFLALLYGASVFQVDLRREGLAGIAGWLIREEITLFNAFPTILRDFLGTLTGDEEFPQIRIVILGSEAITPRDVELFKRHFSPTCFLLNEYGSTESGVARHYFIDKQTPIPGSTVPVGYALPDIETVLWDETGQEIRGDGIGEIVVRSPYLSLGYWGRPDLTEAVFLPDPDGGEARVYRTGDLGRMLPDGCLLYLGRKDFQVKVRGTRVEIAEIETALLRRADVKETVVVAREDVPGETRLIAYLVQAGEAAPTTGELRRFLAARLPDALVPAVFVILDALPTTPNGKVDRRALPAPDRARPELDIPCVAPRTPVEEALAAIWAEVLALETVGIHDPFLELGGNSLMATRMMARCMAFFEVEVPLPHFFASPTIAGLAEALVQHETVAGRSAAIARLRRQIEEMSPGEVAGMLQEKQNPDRGYP